MTSFAAPFLTLFQAAPPQASERAKPKGPPTGPVFIHDCSTGADHATLLLAQWRLWDESRGDS
ncbi:hypothetical protein [Aestuariicoccus sp. MJ-SS9]|uniref:hypothetical protein n=1 Tax=Aestuariicoccus sp. MJ-SS9 TaxID=3079855 RepID=UPI00290AD7FA|nr:hypothetical protein [Aestuariicoccus sp. MJ-SS9]MDU8912621.1 hypothetical protein [Aestuariicoccus sp. MJ-SS9]